MLKISANILMFSIIAMVFVSCGQDTDRRQNTKQYADDGYLGMSNSNPNIPLNPSYHHYNNDIHLMRGVLKRIPEVKDATITIQGPHAYVALVLPDTLAPEDVRRIEDQAYSLLSFNMQRYDIHVTSGVKSRNLL
jgi:hypothetical protein